MLGWDPHVSLCCSRLRGSPGRQVIKIQDVVHHALQDTLLQYTLWSMSRLFQRTTECRMLQAPLWVTLSRNVPQEGCMSLGR